MSKIRCDFGRLHPRRVTPLLLALCLAAACSSKSSKEAPPATAPEAGTPAADPREQACRNNGDGAVCMTAAEHMFLSASRVRELAGFGRDVSDFVPAGVSEAIVKKFADRD